MPECIFTSERSRIATFPRLALAAFLALLLLGKPGATHAAGPETDEDEFGKSPYTEYGEFNEQDDEEAQTRFFQYGRFFGVSLGLGTQTIDGNRGVLWKGGFPLLDFKVHYWFDFNLALDLGFFSATHYFETPVQGQQAVDASIFHLGVDVKYYFDTKNISAPISFANPYVLLGFGSFTKTEFSHGLGETDQEGAMGLSAGAGLEFPIQHRKMYLELEAKAHFVTFRDTHTADYRVPTATPPLDDLTGRFYTFTANLLFTW